MKQLAAAALLLARLASAQPSLVKDIRTVGPLDASLWPVGFVANGSALYFGTSVGVQQSQLDGLWKTDGTAAGCVLLHRGQAFSIVPFRNRVLFTDREELWSSDGTAAGTQRIAVPGTVGQGIFAAPDKVLFFVFGTDRQDELWGTDGTQAGTAMIVRLQCGSSCRTSRFVGRFGERAVFDSDRGLGVTDGTAGGTQFLGVTGFTTAIGVDQIVDAGDKFFFAGPARQYDRRDLWVSDGTAAGTHRVAQIDPDGAFGQYGQVGMAALGGRVVFYPPYPGGLWVSDGTAAGTYRIADRANNTIVALGGFVWFGSSGQVWRSDGNGAASAFGVSGTVFGLAAAGGRLWIMTVNTAGILALWTSDGTPGGTRRLTDRAVTMPATAFQGRVFFAGDDGVHGVEPWSSDGTPAGTAMFADLAPNIAPSSQPRIVGAAGNRVVFDATDDKDVTSMWSSDGTAEGTAPVSANRVGLRSDVRLHGFLYYTMASGFELWRTDGTAAGTMRILSTHSQITRVIATGDFLFIGTDFGLAYTSDGTAAGTAPLAANGYVTAAVAAAGRVVFTTAVDGRLWETDGKNPPRDIAIVRGSDSRVLATAGGTTFLFVDGDLWATDGTADGLRKLRAFPSQLNPVTILGVAEDRLLFALDDGVHGVEPWVSDGTDAGTHLLADIRPGSESSAPSTGATLDGRVLFLADDGIFGRELWVSDGRETAMMRDLAPLGASAEVAGLTAVKGVAFFSAFDPLRGTELWQSDGTADGTRLAADIEPGALSSLPSQFTGAGDTLFFAATTVANGRELHAMPMPWRTIAIDDTRVSETAGTAALTVSLDAPSPRRVTAAWSATDGRARGSLVFEPGETRKTIAVGVDRNAGTSINHVIGVRLSDIAGAVPVRSFASVIVEDVDRAADLEVTLVPETKPALLNNILIVVKNLGGSAVPSVTLQSTAGGLVATLPTLQPGESATKSIAIEPAFGVTATSSIPDPNPSNNSASIQLSPDDDLYSRRPRIAITPFGLIAGTHARLFALAISPTTLQLTSSNPAVMAVPATIGAPGEVEVVALAAGTTTISATDGKTTASMTIVVGATAPYRWPAQLQADVAAGSLVFPAPVLMTARINAVAWDNGARPTGSLIFTADGRPLATLSMDAKNAASVPLASLLPGQHVLTVSYAGDAKFLPDSVTRTLTIHQPPEPTISGTIAPRDAAAEITIVVAGVGGVLPTGTVTLTGTSHALIAEDVPLAGGRATVIVPEPLTTVTVAYSGDAVYPPTVRIVALAPPLRRRAAR